jgi:putative NADPH-quinone reductase
MAQRILIVNGHPDAASFGGLLADRYAQGATAAGAEVRRVNLRDLDFDPILHAGYKTIQPLEPDLVAVQQDVLWADHLVFAYPVWWGAMPALLKGFLDRAFLPGFAFRFASPTSYQWKGLLAGRSARLIVTMDGPPSIIRLLYSDPAIKMMKGMTLEFCGVRPVRVKYVGSVKRATRARRLLWEMQAEDLGRARQ